MSITSKRGWQDRGRIDLNDADHVRLTKILGTSRDDLVRAIGKMRDRAAAARKELVPRRSE